MANINVISSFQVNNALPVDAKYKVANLAGITALIEAGNAYEGMLCYVEDKKALYILDDKLEAKPLLAGTDAEIGDLGDRIGDVEDVIDTLTGEDEGSVAKSIADAIDELGGEAESEDGTFVNVKVTTENGEVTAVNVTENDIASATDVAALQALHATNEDGTYQTVAEEIAKIVDGADEAFDTLKEVANWINNSDEAKEGFNAAQKISNLETAVGKDAEGEAEASGLFARVAGLEEAVGEGGAVADQIDAAIDALGGEAESEDGTFVNVKVTTENGEVTAVSVTENDIASAALLGTAADAADAETAFGKAAAAKAAADAAQDDVDALEELVGFEPEEGEDKPQTVKAYVDAEVAKAVGDASAVADRVTALEGLHADGEAEGSKKTVAEEIADKVITLDAVVDSAAAVEGTAAVTGENPAAAVASTQKVSVKVTEVDGIITEVAVTEKDIASAVVLDEEIARAKAAEAANAQAIADEADRVDGIIGEIGEGETVKSFVEGKIDDVNGAAEELEGKVEDIETSLAEGGATANAIKAAQDAADAAQGDVDALEELVGFEPEEGEDAPKTVKAYIDAEVAKASGAAADVASDLADEVERATGAESDLQDAIDAEKERAEGAESDLQDAIDAEKERAEGAESDLQDAIDAEVAARAAQIGELGKVSEEEGAADHTVKSFVEAKIAEVTGAADDLEERVAANETAIDLLNDAATVEGSVANTVAAEIAKVVDGAGDSFDTLKEIAEWISASEGNEEGFDAAKRIIALETKVGAENVATQISTAVNGEQERAEGAESDLQDAIDAEKERAEGKEAEIEQALADEIAAREAAVAVAAKKLVDADEADLAIGNANTPVYFVNGVPVASTFTIATSVPENAVFTDTTYEAVVATEGAEAGLMTAADKIKLDTIVNGATKVEASETNGNVKINGEEVNVYTHPTDAGNKHIPAGGAAGQYLKYASDGTATWADLIRTGTEVPEDLAAGELFIQLISE